MKSEACLSHKQLKRLAAAREEKLKHAAESRTAFRIEEIYWKNRLDEPDWTLAFHAESLNWREDGTADWRGQTVRKRRSKLAEALSEDLPTEFAEMILFDNLPGLVYLPRLLTSSMQRALVKTSLREGPRRPNTTSLDPHYHLPDEGLWQAFVQDRERQIFCKTVDSNEYGNRRTLTNLEPITAENFQVARECERRILLEREQRQQDNGNGKTESVETALAKLRWNCIGIPYHWGTKTYHLEAEAPEIPSFISKVCKAAVACIPWQEITDDPEAHSWATSYQAQGGIINYYSEKDSLTAHIDHSEADTTRPLVSISLGAAAVFLIGGTTRDDPPIPLYLKSGDVVIMSGKCRRAYHGLPRVILGDEIPSEGDIEWETEGFAEWTKSRRINLNVRQVYPDSKFIQKH